MTLKARRWVSVTCTGGSRPTHFHQFTPYVVNGPSGYEGEETMNNGFRDGHWTGGGAWFLSRYNPTYSKASFNSLNFYGECCLGTYVSGQVAPGVVGQESKASLLSMGTTAIARTEPTAPYFDLAVTIGELRKEGLPDPTMIDMWRRDTGIAKRAGGSYLNYEFGWAPLVRSVEDFSRAVNKSDEILTAYKQGANQSLKKRYEFPPEDFPLWFEPNARFVANPSNGGFFSGSRKITRSKKIWFEGSYRYHIPLGNSKGDQMSRFGSDARKLLGLRLDPEVLWNLSPWSWAADWFGNTGDILHNVSAFGTDGLVLEYGHIMCHARTVEEWVGVSENDGKTVLTATVVSETKQRFPATPYGFGATLSSLNEKQIAILGALGLTML